jgi:hypothetical protein
LGHANHERQLETQARTAAVQIVGFQPPSAEAVIAASSTLTSIRQQARTDINRGDLDQARRQLDSEQAAYQAAQHVENRANRYGTVFQRIKAENESLLWKGESSASWLLVAAGAFGLIVEANTRVIRMSRARVRREITTSASD